MTENTSPALDQNQAPTSTTPSDDSAVDSTPAPEAAADQGEPSTETNSESKDGADDQLLFSKQEEDSAEAEVGEADGEASDGEKVEYADFAIPEGMELDGEMDTSFKEFASKYKIPQEAAQELVDKYVHGQQKQMDVVMETLAGWKKEVVEHPALGGENLNKTLTSVNSLLADNASSPEHLEEMQDVLITMGLGNNRPFIEMMNNIATAKAKATADDSIGVEAGAGGGKSERSTSQVLWPNMKR